MSQQSPPSRGRWFAIGFATCAATALAIAIHGAPAMPPTNPPANQLVGYAPPSTTLDSAQVGTNCAVTNRYINKDVVLRPIAGCND